MWININDPAVDPSNVRKYTASAIRPELMAEGIPSSDSAELVEVLLQEA
jgi:hypothetical protein